jgi:enoyl-CoA hydratase
MLENVSSVFVDSVHDGTIIIIRINRPHARNAVDRETADLLNKAFLDFDENEKAKVAILYGGEEMFCAGADLKAVSSGNLNNTEEQGSGPMGPTRLRLSKPVIAAVAGFAVAGGLELACWCDLRVAKSDATFGVFCRRFGVPLIDGGTVRLPQLIGLSRAMDMILTGRPVSAKEAYEFGLVNRIIEKDQNLLQATIELAESLSEFPQLCMRHDRLSALESVYGDEHSKIMNELKHGKFSLDKETVAGATRFAKGQGRHGDFKSKL